MHCRPLKPMTGDLWRLVIIKPYTAADQRPPSLQGQRALHRQQAVASTDLAPTGSLVYAVAAAAEHDRLGHPGKAALLHALICG